MKTAKISFIFLFFLLVSLHAVTQPTSILVTKKSDGVNSISWRNSSTDVTCKVWFFTNQPITEANKAQAYLLADSLVGTTTNLLHILASYTQSKSTNQRFYYYAVTAFTGGSAGPATPAKLSLNAGMVVNEQGNGNATLLVDEQVTAGDPPSGACSNPWFPGWTGSFYPANAYLDLGATYHLESIRCYDGNDAGNVDFSSGTPGSWTVIATETGGSFGTWKTHTVSADTRYLRVSLATGGAGTSLKEIVLYGYTIGGAWTPLEAGVNASVAGVQNAVPPPQFAGFKISHAGNAETNVWSDVSVRSVDLSSNPFTNYTGVVTLSSTGTVASINWQLKTGNGTFQSLGSGKCAYTYAVNDKGIVILQIRNNKVETVALTAKQGSFTDDDTEGNLKFGGSVPGLMKIKITFAGTPSSVSVSKAALRYNKDFAYSFTMDDGYLSHYRVALPLFKGGTLPGALSTPIGDQGADGTVSPGLFYTDGCGNDIPFRAGLAIYSWQKNQWVDQDLHDGINYTSWAHVKELADNGWDIMNHSFDHWVAPETVNYFWEVTNNVSYVYSKIGYRMNHYIGTGGDSGYKAPAFAAGMKGFYSGIIFENTNPKRVDTYSKLTNLEMNRKFFYGTSGNFTGLQAAAGLAVGGQKYWYNDFTHSVGNDNIYGNGCTFSAFKSYMQQAASTYGKAGTDKMWMAPLQTVYEYLDTRDKAVVTVSQSGNEATVTIDVRNVASDQWHYALSLLVNADQNIVSITGSGGATNITYNNTVPTSRLVNFGWDKSVKMAPGPVAPASVAITSPAAGITVGGPVTVTAVATSPDAAIVSAHFRAQTGGWQVMSGAFPNYSYVWPSTNFSDGNHVLWVKITDDLSRVVSNSVSIKVQNTTRPVSLSVTKPNMGTNQMVWTPVGASGTYRIYCSTTGPLNDGNKTGAKVVASNLSVGTALFRHVVTNAQSTPFWYGVTVATGTKAAGPLGWRRINFTATGPSWGDWMMVQWTGNKDMSAMTALELYVKSVSGNNNNAGIFLQDGSAPDGPTVKFSSKITLSSEWQKVTIPIAELSTGVTMTSLQQMIISGSSADSSIGIDEMRFVGPTPQMIYGDSSAGWWGAGAGTDPTVVNETSGGMDASSTYYEYPLIANKNASFLAVTNRTKPLPPGTMALAAPADGFGSSTVQVAFSWTSALRADGYFVQVATDPGFSAPIQFITNALARTLTLNNGTFYWRARAYNPAGTNAWTAARSFTINTNFIIPTPLLPASLSRTAATNLTFRWSCKGGWNKFRVEVRSNNISGKVVSLQSNHVSTNVVIAIPHHGTYVWRVQAYNVSQSSWDAYSAVTTFYVDRWGPVSSLGLPAHGSTVTNERITFLWNAAVDPAGVMGYEMYLDDILLSTGTNKSYLLLTDFTEGTHSWKVRSVDALGNWGEFATATFEVRFPVDLKIVKPLRCIPTLGNPDSMNPMVFQYNSGKAGKTTSPLLKKKLVIIDMLGNIIYTKEFDPDEEMRWEGNSDKGHSVHSEVYFFYITEIYKNKKNVRSDIGRLVVNRKK